MANIFIENNNTIINIRNGVNNKNIIINGQPLNSCKETVDFCQILTYGKEIEEKEYDCLLIKTIASNIIIKRGEIISAKYSGKYNGKNEPQVKVTTNCNMLNLSTKESEEDINSIEATLMITIPDTVRIVNISTISGFVENNANVKDIEISTTSGDVSGNFSTSHLFVDTMSGNINLTLKGKEKTHIKAKTMSGNINLVPIDYKLELNANSMTGSIFNKAKNNGNNILFGKLETMTGNVNIL